MEIKPWQISPYRGRVKSQLRDVLLFAGFEQLSPTSFHKVCPDKQTRTITFLTTYWVQLTREANLKDGWYESKHEYTYKEIEQFFGKVKT